MKLDQLKSVGLMKGEGTSQALTQRTEGSQSGSVAERKGKRILWRLEML